MDMHNLLPLGRGLDIFPSPNWLKYGHNLTMLCVSFSSQTIDAIGVFSYQYSLRSLFILTTLVAVEWAIRG